MLSYSMTDINSLVARIQTATDYQKNKATLREKIQLDLLLPHNGGMFRASPELIAFLSIWAEDVIYLEDTYQNPIEVNRVMLLDQAKQHYQKVMNTWHQQHAALRKIRKI